MLVHNAKNREVNFQATGEFAITPHNTNLFAGEIVAFGFYVTTGGDIKYDTVDGDTITKTVGSYSYHPIHIKRVYATGTTATGIFGMK
jgi:hypothetical protein